ncbi:glycerophosphodiester phosphodiesterase domain-containing protein 4 isoform X4 [Equus caballus]|uniref:glycerophosphodiester phosphodiesterase domain-containing protein 4 isoform X4 n=1 Tax=Equus caballus TaxID=9796 RepID=UPI000C9E4873|nr:glycerophosphodiester phosphodiesterase domain-containing protein 4 isoform X5 [Equus caballus]
MPTKVNSVEPRSQRTRSQKKHTQGIICYFNHQCYLTFITGCYSCKWKVKREKKSSHKICCCSWRERLFYPFLVASFCLSVTLLYVWIETSNEYFGFDWVVFLGTGNWFYCSILLLSFFGILTAYSTLLLILGFLLIWDGRHDLQLHWFHKILTLLVILLSSFFMWILSVYWKDRWLTAGLSLKVFAPYIHLSSIPVMVLISWPVAFYLIHLEREARIRKYKMTSRERRRVKRCDRLAKLRALQVAIGLPFFLILLCLYVVPLGIYSPCIQEKDKLGPKPDIFGHRGAPMLGPENTMMSFEKAVEHRAFGLETDVYLRDYKAANITINLYLVNEPWLYSLAWCSRIHSVTTDNIQTLSQLNHPYFFMTPNYYVFMWLFVDSVSAIFIVAIFYFHWWNENEKEKFFKSTSTHKDTRNLPKGKTKKSGASVISKPPPRVKESPWTLEALTPALTRSTRKHPGPQQFSAVPEEKASKPLKPVKDDVTQPVPTQEDFELAQEPTREATHKTALPDLKANEPTISSAEVPHPETQPDYTPIVESSQ